jgi:hypothetical protein
MRDYAVALLIKFIMITTILSFVLGAFYGIPFSHVFTISILITGFSFIGDVFLLPFVSNALATIADFGLAWFGVWALSTYLFPQLLPIGTASILSAGLIAFGELFFHRYMQRKIFDPRAEEQVERKPLSQNQLQTEFSSELDSVPEDEQSKDGRND